MEEEIFDSSETEYSTDSTESSSSSSESSSSTTTEDRDVRMAPRPFITRPVPKIITNFNSSTIPFERPVLIRNQKCVVIDDAKYRRMKENIETLLSTLNDTRKMNQFYSDRIKNLEGRNIAVSQYLMNQHMPPIDFIDRFNRQLINPSPVYHLNPQIHNVPQPNRNIPPPLRTAGMRQPQTNSNLQNIRDSFLKPTLRRDLRK